MYAFGMRTLPVKGLTRCFFLPEGAFCLRGVLASGGFLQEGGFGRRGVFAGGGFGPEGSFVPFPGLVLL